MRTWENIRSKMVALVERSIAQTYDKPNEEADALRSEVELLKSRLATATRHKMEFFGLIERIEKQRDEWREMFKRSAMEQMTALNIVDRALASERRKLTFLVARLNEFLEKDGKPLIDESKLPVDSSPPMGEYKRYAESMIRLFHAGAPEVVGRDASERRPHDIDAKQERDRLVQESFDRVNEQGS